MTKCIQNIYIWQCATSMSQFNILYNVFLYTRNLSLPFLPSKVHARGHTVCKKGLPCVRDWLGNTPSWVSSSRRPSHHALLLIEPPEPSYPALPVSTGWQEVHTTEDVLCNPSYDHTGPWEQVGDTHIQYRHHKKIPVSSFPSRKQLTCHRSFGFILETLVFIVFTHRQILKIISLIGTTGFWGRVLQ